MSAAGDDNKASRSSGSAIDAGNPGDAQHAVTPGHLTLRQAAQRLRMSSREVRQLLAAGQLRGFWGRDDNGAATAFVYEDAVQALADRVERITPR